MSKTSSKNPVKNVSAGALAGLIEATINYPTEFVKTQLQLQRRGGAAVAAGGAQPPTPQFAGPWDVVRSTVRQKGISGLYSGLTSLIVGTTFKSAVRFGSYERYAQMLRGEDGKLTTARTMLAGLMTGTTEAVLAVTPTETIKTKLIDDTNRKTPRFRGMVHGVRTIVTEEVSGRTRSYRFGLLMFVFLLSACSLTTLTRTTHVYNSQGIRGIYKGLSPTIAKQAVNSMVRFTVYNALKKELLLRKEMTSKDRSLSVAESLVCGLFAGTVNVYVTMPLDVVKTRMQGLEAAQFTSMADCFAQTVRHEGALALWRGSLPRLMRVGPSGGIMFVSYEQALKALNIAFPEPTSTAV
jgi:solute carrier family 25 citrate transporter 1